MIIETCIEFQRPLRKYMAFGGQKTKIFTNMYLEADFCLGCSRKLVEKDNFLYFFNLPYKVEKVENNKA